MRIGIDARLIAQTGVGRYIRNLITGLAKLDETNHYVVFLRRDAYEDFSVPNKHWEKRLAEVPWHSLREQVIMPLLLAQAHLDVVHIPYHNPPVFYGGNLVVTIHDLTILHFTTGRATTKPAPFYWLRRLGYQLVLNLGLRRARRIITVSAATKAEIMEHFPASRDKITVTYEGVDKEIQKLKREAQKEKPLIPDKYFLYVGNAYPHKNLETLFKALSETSLPVKLILVGKDDFFYRRLQREIIALGLASRVVLFGGANDHELANLYSHAVALISPSFMEGFGLPALEALALNTPVICSDIRIFREILGNIPAYFDPHSVSSLVRQMHTVWQQHREMREKLSTSVPSWLKRYSWRNLARDTLNIYLNAAEKTA